MAVGLLFLFSCNQKEAKGVIINSDLYTILGQEKKEFSYSFDENAFQRNSDKPVKDIAMLAFDLSVHITEDEELSSRENLEKRYLDLGFENIYFNDEYYLSPTQDSVGYAIALKRVEKYVLVALTVRGLDYYLEWIGNFNCGNSGAHKNIQEVSSRAYMGLKGYIAPLRAENLPVKILITGYSRGGAIAEFIGKALDDDIYGGEIKNVSTDDVFVYAFSAPKMAPLGYYKNTRYKNVINFVNSYDVIASFFPDYFGMARIGYDYDILQDNAIDVANELYDVNVKPFNNYYSSDSFEHFIKGLIDDLCKQDPLSSRESYYERLFPAIKFICEIIYNDAPYSKSKANGVLTVLKDKISFGKIFDFISGDDNALYDDIRTALDEGGVIYDEKELELSYTVLVEFLQNCFNANRFEFAVKMYTVIENFNYSISWHTPEICLACLQLYF